MLSHQNLESLFDKSGIEALNARSPEQVSNCLHQPNLDLALQSLDDQELLIMIPFTIPVKIAQISIKCKPESVDRGSGPRNVKLFVNEANMDFSAAAEMKPKQELVFTEDDLKKGNKLNLRYVNFQNVRQLTVYVESNTRDVDVSEVGYLSFYGQPESTLDMNNWKPTETPQE